METVKRAIIEHLLSDWIENNEVIEDEIKKKIVFENKGGARIIKKIGLQEDRLRRLFYLLCGERISQKAKGVRAAEILSESRHLLLYSDGDKWKTSFHGSVFNMLSYMVAEGLDAVYGHREDNIEKLMSEVRKRWREKEEELGKHGVE
jgi:hypothetical protein|nr:MAG TPA: hypothetical protein [Caudoviricetes sp.]